MEVSRPSQRCTGSQRTRVTLPELQARITRQRAAADVAREKVYRSARALRRHRQSSSNISNEIEELSARAKDLWRDIEEVISKRSDLLKRVDRCDRLFKREQQQYQMLHQEMVVADTELAQAMEELQTAEAECITLEKTTAQLRDLLALIR